jgi:hypothetical protein
MEELSRLLKGFGKGEVIRLIIIYLPYLLG